jgi:hypothetical protein
MREQALVHRGLLHKKQIKLKYFAHVFAILYPLTPELKPSAQRCLTRFFTGDFAS